MFNFEVNSAKKTFLITTSGMFKKEEAIEFIEEFEKKVKTIDPKQYILIINAKEQKPSSPDILPLQEKAIGLYLNTPFAKRFSIEFDSAITMQQIKRIGKNEMLDGFTFVNSLEEALKK